jgi:hypothetical protein
VTDPRFIPSDDTWQKAFIISFLKRESKSAHTSFCRVLW